MIATTCLLMLTAFWPAMADDDPVGELPFQVRAVLPAGPWEVGADLELIVEFEQAGEIHQEFPWEEERGAEQIRRPLLHVLHHDGVALVGDPIGKPRGPEDTTLSYLRFPYGRRLTSKRTVVPFRLTAEPGNGDVLQLNVVTYVDGLKPEDATFVRRRIVLPLRPDASAVGVDSRDSTWGKKETLAIGDQAPEFALPGLNNQTVKLSDMIGTKRALIMAYRRST